ncbi:hypothetical protein BJF93_13435 [Xaviernesmea oryzae]|uniref:Uncharacterized protein n=1 Tax=Xaviernesmea oryzae TaxID=464029 RepID=A0A1Q9AR47_9HYPH|nr:hypothetical protein BJF93_13435 [Xaviernesmea oryzae]
MVMAHLMGTARRDPGEPKAESLRQRGAGRKRSMTGSFWKPSGWHLPGADGGECRCPFACLERLIGRRRRLGPDDMALISQARLAINRALVQRDYTKVSVVDRASFFTPKRV